MNLGFKRPVHEGYRCFETYAGALLDFSVMRYVQVRREEYREPEDWDALQEACREYDEVEHQVRLEERTEKNKMSTCVSLTVATTKRARMRS